MNRFALGLSLALTALGCPAAELGQPAAPLSIGKWIKGEPVDLSADAGKKILVVEFWATWCGPCRTSIPHLTHLQKKYQDRGVTILGISTETEAKVKPFVEQYGDKMGYAVALDDRRKTSAAYLEAFGVNGIPHAFVIDPQGRIAWHGHPMAGLDNVLEDLVAGRYDIAAAKRVEAASRTMSDYFSKAVDGAEPASLRDLGDQVVRDGAASVDLLNEFAWVILTHPQIKSRDIELATRAARLAFDKTEGRNASVADTYARAFLEAGKIGEAVEMQKKAAAAETDAGRRAQLERTLQEYQAQLK